MNSDELCILKDIGHYYSCYKSLILYVKVAEVLSKDKTRLSINGWFHGPIEPRPPRFIEPARPLHPYVNMEVCVTMDSIVKLGE